MSPNILKNTLAIMHQSKNLLTLFSRPLVTLKVLMSEILTIYTFHQLLTIFQFHITPTKKFQ